MKTSKFFSAVVLSIALIATVATGCKKKDSDSGLELSQSKATLTVGETKQLKATYNGSDVTAKAEWASSDAAIATVEAGLITAKAAGSANITVKYEGNEAVCKVTVDGAVPDIPAPDATHAKIAIQIPAGTECYGITFHGSISQDAWALADWEFEAVEGAENWYVAEVEINPEADSQGAVCYGKPCLWREDGTISDNWSTQWTTGSVVKGDDVAAIGMGGEANKVGFLKSGVVYFKVTGWQEVPCAQSTTVKFSIKVPVCDVVETVAFIGSMTDWSDEAMEWNASTNYWEVEYDVQAGGEFKFRDIDQGWGNQLQSYNEETGEWSDFSNFVLTEEDIAAGAWTMDFSDTDKYRWSNCASPADPNEPQVNVKFTWNGQDGFELAEGDKLIFTGNFEELPWGESTREMTANGDGTYSWTGDIPAAFECKIFVVTTDKEGKSKQVWGNEGNIKLTSEDVYPYSFDMSVDYPAAPEE